MEMRKLVVWTGVTAILLTGCNDDATRVEPATTFQVTLANVSEARDFFQTGVFDTPTGAMSAGPAGPGATFEFEFAAPPGARLSFASIFGQSNDLFFAPDVQGIALFEGNAPRSADVTGEIRLWDAGTEMNQEPGVGDTQAPRQSAPDTGPVDEDPRVRLAADEFGNLPPVDEILRATLTSLGGNRFSLRLENIGTAMSLPTSVGPMPAPMSPGVWVVHTEDAPLFTVGEADRGEGLERIAEDGNPSMLAEDLSMRAGVVTPLSPGVWVVHSGDGPLFTPGAPDRGEGLEGIAEDANPTALANALAGDAGLAGSGVFDTPVSAANPGPALPGRRYQWTIEARPGDRLSFATMFGQSNDLFYAPGPAGIALFTGDTPRSADVSDEISLWDAGTEVNEAPGAGPNQAPRQSAAGEGTVESRPIGAPDDGFTYPATSGVIQVTITPQ